MKKKKQISKFGNGIQIFELNANIRISKYSLTYLLVIPVFWSDLCKENKYCKAVSLNAFGLLVLLWTNMENISRILIFRRSRPTAKFRENRTKIFHFPVNT